MLSVNSPFSKLSMVALLPVALALSVPVFGQSFARPDGSVPLPLDWSNKHVVFTTGYTPEQAKKMENEPRAAATWLLHGNGPVRFHRHDHDHDSDWGRDHDRNGHGQTNATIKRDWAVSLGAGGVAAGMAPAKYNFDVNATPSCTADFAVFPINHTTGNSRATVVGTFSTTTYWDSTASSVVVTLTPTGGTAFTLTLVPSGSLNTNLDFQVPTTGSHTTAADTAATNLAAAINRNLVTDGNALSRFVAIAATNTVKVYALTPGNGVTLTDSESMNNFGWGTVSPGGPPGGQANIVALNHLYTGTATSGCSGYTWPTFTFSYASGVGAIVTSPSLSLDGTKIAYVENDTNIGAIFHVLTIGSGTEISTCASNTGSQTPLCATTPVIPGSTSGSNASDFMLPLGLIGNKTTGTDTYSSPFIDFANDTAYVGDDNGYLFSITPVFNGSIPAHAGGSYPVTLSAGGNNIAAPVVDVSGTGNIFVGDSGANLYNVSSAGVVVATKALGSNFGGIGVRDAVLIDSTNAVGYAADNCNGFTGTPTSEIYQFGFTAAAINAKTTADLSTEGCTVASTVYSPTPDNNYFNKGISSATAGSNGELLAAYASTAGSVLGQFQFTSSAMGATAQFTDTAHGTAGQTLSPPTEFYGNDVSYTISGITQSGGTVTVTTSAANAFTTGQMVTIGNVAAGTGGCNAQAATSINGEAYITVTNTTTFTFTIGNQAAISTGNCALTGATAVGPTKDYLFFGITAPEVFTYTVPLANATQAATATETTSASGGTSGIIVDNDSTTTQAASIYFGTLTTSTGECGTTVYCAVKLTQSGLN